ncbi:MAG: DUF1648 domain-containing protein [Patescibacteria group bacterium]
MSKAKSLALFLIGFSFAFAFYFYPQMPERMASHWNFNGEVDGYMPKFFGTFLLPLMSLFLFALFIAIPKIDPLKANVAKFQKYFDGFILVFEIFFFYIYLLTILWSAGSRFDMTAAMMPAMAILFYYMGIMIGKAERNFFIGIRTPWTLSSDKVWDKTHRLGGKLFKAVAALTALGFFFPAYAFFLMFVPIIGVSIYLIVYSYVEFKKEGRAENAK